MTSALPPGRERYLEEHPPQAGESGDVQDLLARDRQGRHDQPQGFWSQAKRSFSTARSCKFDRTEMKNSITLGVDMLIFSEPDGKVAKLETNVLWMMTVCGDEGRGATKASRNSELDIGLMAFDRLAEVPGSASADTVITASPAMPSRSILRRRLRADGRPAGDPEDILGNASRLVSRVRPSAAA